MQSRWSDSESSEFVARYVKSYGGDLALRTYTSRLIGAESALVLHGGGNTSVKTTFTDLLGRELTGVFVKASGHDLAVIEPEGHTGLYLDGLSDLRALETLDDGAMVNAFLTTRFDSAAATPSIEALLHAFIPATYVDHTHADAILALTNQPNGMDVVREALGGDVIVIDYVKPGFHLAKAAADAYDKKPDAVGMVLAKHGLLTWGEDARESYERTIDLVTRAEEYLARHAGGAGLEVSTTDSFTARERFVAIAPVLRGLLAVETGDPDLPYDRMILRPLITDEALSLVDSERGKKTALTPPLTADHLIRTKPFVCWVDDPVFDDPAGMKERLAAAVESFATEYDAYVDRHASRLASGVERFDPIPRVIMIPGVGVVCAGRNVAEAGIVRDITAQTTGVKLKLAEAGCEYVGLSEDHLFDMEYFSLQHAKLSRRPRPALESSVAVVTGAAGAIGAGVCEGLLEAGCHVAVSDVDAERLVALTAEFKRRYGDRVFAVPIDVTSPESVRDGFGRIIQGWGGIDIVIANAGAAHVAALSDLEPDVFRKLEAINVEGTLHVFAEAGRHFEKQGTGGDIVLVSTKNVFAPGATFGAYSATKAAAHQLARIASQELAPLGVRVNMVSPDAVFSHGEHRSGLWSEVGPGRMKARGLDEKGLEDYYKNRNLLKMRVTAEHVANAILFFVTHQTPTTGATIPIDGGLPDSTPR
jgi:rhamnose utilization protein RhaD (predicted bifunctional aldolase and dehydrogenase)/NAD(P)-dependent dehydrogenase (short-subunit alcohol dehydrogenase family)